MAIDKWSLLSRLQRAVKKVKVILNLDINRWRLVASLIGASPTKHRRVSFNERPGLRDCADYVEESEDSVSGNSSVGLHRTISYPSEDDIDKRAEMFIENFRRQLQIERQISLELKYLQENSSFKLRSP
ncbi:uncharacterized protein LOC110600261 [Manihot esculenta]|uniref:Uncharacterized protein n=1 Tax=Manihot esculenta TaxID=3983 RepID=A0A2C9UN30_MANES|nr:uncharacterized protein LOC110600261 [Manihot esculenta]OAY31909.1 hypothetical protein MANES_14G151300v8 [Manihot esculenta]